jgi:hypothetical protein
MNKYLVSVDDYEYVVEASDMRGVMKVIRDDLMDDFSHDPILSKVVEGALDIKIRRMLHKVYKEKKE